MGIELRPMEPKDLAEVKGLHEQCFPVRYEMVRFDRSTVSDLRKTKKAPRVMTTLAFCFVSVVRAGFLM